MKAGRDNDGRASERDTLFVLEYLVDRNGTRAYKASHPRCRSTNTAAVEASRLLRKPKVQALLREESRARVARLRLDADEAFARVSCVARANICMLLGSDGQPLPVSMWPEEVAMAVRVYRRLPGGGVEIALHDSMKALELVLTACGRLGAGRDRGMTFDHAALLTRSQKAPK